MSEVVVTPNLLALLAIFYYRRNKVVGIHHPTSQVMLLIAARQHLIHRETNRYAQAVYLRGVIESRTREMDRIIEQAQSADDKKPFLERALEIETEISSAVTLLEKLESVEWSM